MTTNHAPAEHALVNGYTELKVLWLFATPVPMPLVCVSCAKPLQRSDVGRTGVFRIKDDDSVRFYTTDGRPVTLEARLCKQCSTGSGDVGEFFQLGLDLDVHREHFLFQIGNPSTAAVFEKHFRETCPGVEERFRDLLNEKEGVHLPYVPGMDFFKVVSVKRLTPGQEGWKAPLREKPSLRQPIGCALILLTTALFAGAVLALVLAVT